MIAGLASLSIDATGNWGLAGGEGRVLGMILGDWVLERRDGLAGCYMSVFGTGLVVPRQCMMSSLGSVGKSE